MFFFFLDLILMLSDLHLWRVEHNLYHTPIPKLRKFNSGHLICQCFLVWTTSEKRIVLALFLNVKCVLSVIDFEFWFIIEMQAVICCTVIILYCFYTWRYLSLPLILHVFALVMHAATNALDVMTSIFPILHVCTFKWSLENKRTHALTNTHSLRKLKNQTLM